MIEELQSQVYRFAFWSAVIMVASGTASLALPLDVPGGASASHAERISWLLANRGTFILAWLNQIIAMASLTGALAGLAWLVGTRSPLAGLLSAAVLLASFMAFIIPKFMAVWSIPLLAVGASTPGVNQPLADSLLMLLNVSAPFSLFTSFDYLGFWLYAVFGLLVAPYLLHGGVATRLSAVSFIVFGISYHGVMVAVLLGVIGADAIESYALSVSMLVILPSILALFLFRGIAMTSHVPTPQAN